MHTLLVPNKPEVVSEKFEDEIILVSLINGNYYSLRGTAVDIWLNIEASTTAQKIIDAFTSAFGLNQEQIDSISQFFNDLHTHELVKAATQNGVEEGKEIQVGSHFEIPVVEAYSDMQDLLLLDPIHDVDEKTGWPAQANAGADK